MRCPSDRRGVARNHVRQPVQVSAETWEQVLEICEVLGMTVEEMTDSSLEMIAKEYNLDASRLIGKLVAAPPPGWSGRFRP